MAVTVAVADAVTVAVADDVTVTVGETVGETVGVTVTVADADADADDVTADDGLWAPGSVVACVAVPVSAITAAPTARQPDARMIRIAISPLLFAGPFDDGDVGNGS
jgi:hypothetical protein